VIDFLKIIGPACFQIQSVEQVKRLEAYLQVMTVEEENRINQVVEILFEDGLYQSVGRSPITFYIKVPTPRVPPPPNA